MKAKKNIVFIAIFVLSTFVLLFQNFTSTSEIVTKTFLPGEFNLINGSALNIGGNVSANLTIEGRLQIIDNGKTLWETFNKSTCKTRILSLKCPASSAKFLNSGNLFIKSDEGKDLFSTDTANLSHPKLIISNQSPYISIQDDNGIAFMGKNRIDSFVLYAGQRIKVGSTNSTLSLNTDGNIVLTSKDNTVLWQSNSSNVKYGFYNWRWVKKVRPVVLKLTNGNLTLYDQSNDDIFWTNSISQNLNNGMSIYAVAPYLKITDSLTNQVKWATGSNPLKCASSTPGSVSCLHPDMPIYTQNSSELLQFINANEKTNIPYDPGWCAPTSMAMLAKTFALEKLIYFNTVNDSQFSGNILDKNESSPIIYNMMKAAQTDIIKGGTEIANMLSGILSYIPGKFIPGSSSLYDAKFNGSLLFAYANEADYLKKIPMGLVAQQCTSTSDNKSAIGHALVINGKEGNYLKIFDPWGGIYNVNYAKGSMTFAFMDQISTGGSELSYGCTNQTAAVNAIFGVTGHVPMAQP